MEGLDAAAEELRHVRELVYRRDREAVLGYVRSRPAARDELDSELHETGGELVEPGLVEDRDERPLDCHGSGG